MGAAISDWRLANSVSRLGQLGVVSGTALDLVLARRLQLGDIGGHIRDAFDHFPFKEVADRVWKQYFVEGGKAVSSAFKSKPVPNNNPSEHLTELTLLANFVEVYLAKRGHNNPVGINFLEKIQLPNLISVYGAMLAGVDYVLMGAGIPRYMPAILDNFAQYLPYEVPINVQGAHDGETFKISFDPANYKVPGKEALHRPIFLAIISSTTLAISLAKKTTPPVDGFVIEGPTAGGHNAPPRGPLHVDENDEPIYGPKDVPDLVEIGKLGLPFWLAGSYGRPGGLREALELGATGIQVGTAFAFCEESGMREDLKEKVLTLSREGKIRVKTDHRASPTGFPFKVVQLEGTMADPNVIAHRDRICDLGYLRTQYRGEDGNVKFRCPSEPVHHYLRNGGAEEDTVGRLCVCNGLMATIGLGQNRKGYEEAPLVTAGDEAANVYKWLDEGQTSYSAESVINKLVEGCEGVLRACG